MTWPILFLWFPLAVYAVVALAAAATIGRRLAERPDDQI